jgi:hypothetical protein
MTPEQWRKISPILESAQGSISAKGISNSETGDARGINQQL